MSKNDNKALKGLDALRPFDKKNDELVRIVIETPKGSRNKYAFDPEEGLLELKRVLPAGMYFPYDFGFVPSTLADDGDPIDVIVIMDEPAFPGCVLKARLLGVIEGEQTDGKKTQRNDRLVAIEQQNHTFAHVQRMEDLGEKFVEELEEFFVNYHKQQGKKFKVLGVKDKDSALELIQQAQKARKKNS